MCGAGARAPATTPARPMVPARDSTFKGQLVGRFRGDISTLYHHGPSRKAVTSPMLNDNGAPLRDHDEMHRIFLWRETRNVDKTGAGHRPDVARHAPGLRSGCGDDAGGVRRGTGQPRGPGSVLWGRLYTVRP